MLPAEWVCVAWAGSYVRPEGKGSSEAPDFYGIGPDDAIRRSGASEPLRFERAVEDLAKLRGEGVGVDAPLDLDRRLAEG